MVIVIIIIFILEVILLGVIWRHLTDVKNDIKKEMENNADNLSEQVNYQLTNEAYKSQMLQNQNWREITDGIYTQLRENRLEMEQRLSHLETRVSQTVKELQESNEQRLEEMRQTVSDKLEETLQSRLKTSFDTVSKQLENVNKGLGEMQVMARDVDNLNRTLSNVKTRGILGEIQLGQIIEDLLTPRQYEREYAVGEDTSKRVEYAIKMPGRVSGEVVYLPIDSKFPLEAYNRLQDAYEKGDKAAIEQERKVLFTSIKTFAKMIQSKYVNPPKTTEFGIMFLPTEGLYSEVVRDPVLFESLRKDYAVIVSGPSTLSALLSSLSVGFKTMTIQQHAKEIADVLQNVKHEFDKFEGLLTKAQRQMQTASNSIDLLLTTRTRKIQKALSIMETIEKDDNI